MGVRSGGVRSPPSNTLTLTRDGLGIWSAGGATDISPSHARQPNRGAAPAIASRDIHLRASSVSQRPHRAIFFSSARSLVSLTLGSRFAVRGSGVRRFVSAFGVWREAGAAWWSKMPPNVVEVRFRSPRCGGALITPVARAEHFDGEHMAYDVDGDIAMILEQLADDFVMQLPTPPDEQFVVLLANAPHRPLTNVVLPGHPRANAYFAWSRAAGVSSVLALRHLKKGTIPYIQLGDADGNVYADFCRAPLTASGAQHVVFRVPSREEARAALLSRGGTRALPAAPLSPPAAA